MRRALIVAILGAAFCAPASAHEPLPPLGGALFGGIVRDSDVDLFFDYLRDSTRAAIEGREAPLPEALVSRAEQVTDELKRRGGMAARILIDVIERSVREGMRDAPPAPHRLPPSYPAQRI